MSSVAKIRFFKSGPGPGRHGPVGFRSGSGLVQPLGGPGAEWSARNSVFTTFYVL